MDDRKKNPEAWQRPDAVPVAETPCSEPGAPEQTVDANHLLQAGWHPIPMKDRKEEQEHA